MSTKQAPWRGSANEVDPANPETDRSVRSQPWRYRLKQSLKLLLVLGLATLVLGRSNLPPGDQTERVRAYTRSIEFDFITWTLDALSIKGGQQALSSSAYLPLTDQSEIVIDYLALVQEIQQSENQLNLIYADPTISDPEAASHDLRELLSTFKAEQEEKAPLVEAILQSQVQGTLSELGLTLGGQPIPPVLYHTSDPPMALIVSPRETIRQDENISITPNLSTAEQVALEDQVEGALDLSALVVPVGGIGLYPTMVMETSNINWLAEVVAHEWIHNYLTLRPLGISYFESPALRTINETVASIAGKEIGRAMIARFYPEYLPPPPTPAVSDPPPMPENPTEPPPFDFRAEMAETRRSADQLLAEGKIIEAEAYMESRRQFLWENGYRLRKINQAYFAFYGAYADQPGGASAGDPVGDAVRAFRSENLTLESFVKRAAWVTSFENLLALLEASDSS